MLTTTTTSKKPRKKRPKVVKMGRPKKPAPNPTTTKQKQQQLTGTQGRRTLSKHKDWIYRSKAEASFGDSLVFNLENVKYEPTKYMLQVELGYVPDFYVEDLNLWIEFKGTFDVDDRKKSTAFFTQVSSNYLVVLQRRNIKMINRKSTNEHFLSSVGIPFLFSDTAVTVLSRWRDLVASGKKTTEQLLNELEKENERYIEG